MRKAICSIGLLLAATSLYAQSLTATNSWVGNMGGKPANHIMHNVDNIFVRDDGTVYAITGWEEGGSNVSVFKSGALISVPENSGTGGWGRMSGSAVTADSAYIYQVLSQHGCDGGNSTTNANSLPQYPPCETGNQPVWKCIARYTQNGTLAPFSQGYGFKGAFLLISANGKMPCGIAVGGGELFVADPTGDTVKVYNTANLTTTPIREFHVPRVGLLSIDSQGYLWMLQPADSVNAAKIVRISRTSGMLQPQQITFAAGIVPTAFGIDKKQNRILVTDNGVNQNIRIYGSILTTPALVGTFGTQGGITSGTPGEIAPLKFINPMGVGVDSIGNIYVASTGLGNGAGRGTEMECYSAAGVRAWVLYGLVFTANADVDRSSEMDVYTFDRHFRMDYSKTQPGSEWSYKGYTVNSFKYPEDPRMQNYFFTSALVRKVRGNRILYTSDMYGSCLSVYRFNASTDGEVAIPCGFFTSGSVGTGWPTGHDATKEWLWRDVNNDGKFQANEYDNQAVDNSYSMAWGVDDSAGIWKGVREQGLRYFPLQGFDANGAPQYSYASSIKYPLPTGINGVKRICYDRASDALYLGGFSSQVPDTGDSWWCLGSTISKYSGWLAGNRTPTWTLTLPFTVNGETGINAKAFCVEKEYLFVAASKTGKIYVYKTSDTSLVGTISPGAETDFQSGWTDIDIAVTAMKRESGEYLVFMEENGKGKVMMYRWCPSGLCATSALKSLQHNKFALDNAQLSNILVTNLAGRTIVRACGISQKQLVALSRRIPRGIYIVRRSGSNGQHLSTRVVAVGNSP